MEMRYNFIYNILFSLRPKKKIKGKKNPKHISFDEKVFERGNQPQRQEAKLVY